MKSWILRKSSLIVLSTLICSLYLLAFYFNGSIYDMLVLRRFAFTDYGVTNTTKKILYWNTFFGDETFYLGNRFHDCPVNDCYATHDRSYADLLEFDAILFHANELDLKDLPTRRSPRQWYVFVNLESPGNRPLISQFYEDYFNLTMTYRLDSDVVWTYGTVSDADTGRVVAPLLNTTWTIVRNRTGAVQENHTDASLRKTIQGKTKPIIWFVSNCNARSGRDQYMHELSRHVTVDVYGSCGKHVCPQSTDCFTGIAEPDYFFYLSFENTLCEDYVTEKLYNALSYNIVPIVYGGANYSLFAPPRSYINVLDFDTPKKLAEYLTWLMNNPREYARYFEWKRYYRINKSSRHAACGLCEFLRREMEPRWHNALSGWYSSGKCPMHSFLRNKMFVTGAILKNQD
ncbi:Alpha-(1,3)-fucosyltransferase C [Dufourea novaeangliae]|uniref:Fucosyltransferase n=1 Tax=Dufourea novaeangliae TaxID=178035 RepID=A0A154PNF0_DUFNO|nr:Alpha-(1,3)-fucosyltransferase C [Dufourea novaeangliae]